MNLVNPYIKNMQTKSGYQGDMLIGYSGHCWKCGEERRLYFANCRDDVKKEMIYALLTGVLEYKGACEVCLPHGLKDSITSWRLMKRSQVDKDLSVLNSGMMMNFEKAVSDQRENQKNDKWLDDNEKHVDEYVKYRKAHDLMI